MVDEQELSGNAVSPVVGIGASAGGLEALLELFAHLPADTGFAFVVLLHSSPDHPNLLPQILSGKTPLPVSEAREDTELEADHVYIVPPKTFPDLSGGRLVLSDRSAPEESRKPIDHLFRSLARALGRKAIGVVLSGACSDGALGLEAIKSRGGLAFVQDPASALFDAMPRNAIKLGGVDFIRPPREIAEKLVRISRQSFPDADRTSLHIGGDELGRIFGALRAACGIDFSHYKRSTILRRLARRLALNKMHSISDYLALLNSGTGEAMALCQDFLIRVTGFFREPDMFHSLAEEVFPRLIQGRSPKNSIRIWVPGCSTGEEVYSIAIAWLEFLSERSESIPVVLFGTDLNGPAIEHARAGLYSGQALWQISPERLKRFFTKVDDRYQIKTEVRGLCVFAQHNVAQDPPFSKLDLISCCNLLIYFGPALQQRVTTTFHYALAPDGFLVLGPSESISQQCTQYFNQIDKQRRIYTRRDEPGRLLLDVSHASEKPMTFDPVKAAPEKTRPMGSDAMQREIDQLILQCYAPAGLVIDEYQNVIQFSGQVGPFLEPRPGRASLNLQNLVRPGLLMAISSAVAEVRTLDTPVRRKNIRIETDAGERLINLDVVPLRETSGDTRYFLAIFHDLSAKQPEAPAKRWLPERWSDWLRGKRPAAEIGTDSVQLRRELEATQMHLRAIFEAYESTQEELKSIHEELLTAKEEFQTTNEELETAKEELQSANEELITANEELRVRNNELSRANADIQEARDYAEAIVDSTQAALLVLDEELRVRRANRPFSELFRIPREAAEGHFLGDIGQGAWNGPELLSQLDSVVIDGARIENFELMLEIPPVGRRILVFNARRLIGGAELSGLILLSMLDVTERRGAEAMLKQQSDLLDQAHEAILIWPLGGLIRYWNRGAEELYGWTREEAVGQVSHELLGTRRGISPDEFERRLRDDRQWIGEVIHTTRAGAELVVDSRYTVQEQSDGTLLVLETNRDITERKRAEESLRRADRQKDEFLAMLAHELRNPLAPLRNALGILQKANPNRVPLEEIVAMMDRQVVKLSRIVDDLLDIARITRGQIELRKEIVDLVSLIGHVVEYVGPQLRACEHELSVSLPDRAVPIEADPVRLEQIIENLLCNAVKYTAAGGHIGIMLETSNDQALFRISDNGRGISPEALPNIFDLFMQADCSLDRRQGGLGIGLTLVRRLTELHGGHVEADSAGLGLGSRFTVSLPLAKTEEGSKKTSAGHNGL